MAAATNKKSFKEQARAFCKYYLNQAHTYKYRGFIVSGEGGFSSMVENCLSYMRELNSAAQGIAAFQRYLAAEYDIKLFKNGQTSRMSEYEPEQLELQVDCEGWSTYGEYYDYTTPLGERVSEEVEPLVGSPLGASPEGLYPLKGEGGGPVVRSWQQYLDRLDEKERAILEVWANTKSYTIAAELCEVDYNEVKRVYQNAKRQASRITEAVDALAPR